MNLPELSRLPNGAWVYIVEGEACVDAARAIGLVATTSAGGSKAAGKSDWSVMRGKVAVILPDRDPAGDAYADKVAGLCHAAGAQEVRVLRLAEHWTAVPPGGDIADVLAMESGDAEVVRANIDALAVAAEAVAPEAPVDDRPDDRPAFDLAALFPAATADIRDYFADLARSTQTPPDMAALLGMAVASACICNVACVRGHGDHIEPAPPPRCGRWCSPSRCGGHAQVSRAGGTAAADPEMGGRQGPRDAACHRRGGPAAPHHLSL